MPAGGSVYLAGRCQCESGDADGEFNDHVQHVAGGFVNQVQAADLAFLAVGDVEALGKAVAAAAASAGGDGDSDERCSQETDTGFNMGKLLFLGNDRLDNP